ncbi:MAG: AarF/UbiB family protein [Actinomycetota bacterium]
MPPSPIAPSDLELGTFSDSPPWTVEPAAMTWRVGLDEARRAARGSVPVLTRERRLPPGRRVGTTIRHLGGAIALWRLRDKRKGGDGSTEGLSRRLRVAAEHLGPTYIKLAQIISAGEGLFPDPLVEQMKLCRDRVRPEPFETVKQVIEEDFGKRLDELFLVFDPQSIAAASIAQVHRARLRDGTPVVVKVQRSTVQQRVRSDLEVLSWLAPMLIGRIPVTALANPPALVELFAETIVEELDFRLEAENLLDVAGVLRELGQTDWVVPRPHPELVTERVLVMEQVDGFRFEDVSAIRDAGVDTHRVVRNVMIAFLESATLHGIFHGDFHGGNLFVQPDGKVALLDFGITARFDERRRRAFLRMMVGATANDVKTQMAAFRDLGALPRDVDLDAVISDLGLDRPPIDPTTLSQDELLTEVQRVVKALLGYGARMPKDLMLFVKNMIFLSSMIEQLAPDVDLLAEVQHIAMHFAMSHGDKLLADTGVALSEDQIDLDGVKASWGLDPEVDSISYNELKARRELILKRMGGQA